MAWRAMPRCNNMSLRRTKSKVAMTVARHFRNTDAYLSREFFPSPHAGLAARPCEALTLKGKTALRLCPCPIPESLNSRLFSPLPTLSPTVPVRSYCRISGQRRRLTIKEAICFDPVTAADRGAETAIREALAEAYPAHGILGEEFGADRGRGRLLLDHRSDRRHPRLHRRPAALGHADRAYPRRLTPARPDEPALHPRALLERGDAKPSSAMTASSRPSAPALARSLSEALLATTARTCSRPRRSTALCRTRRAPCVSGASAAIATITACWRWARSTSWSRRA